jgi:hypothetical protein
MLKAKFKRSSNESDESDRESPNQHKLRQETLKLLDQERKAQPGEYDWGKHYKYIQSQGHGSHLTLVY